MFVLDLILRQSPATMNCPVGAIKQCIETNKENVCAWAECFLECPRIKVFLTPSRYRY